MENVLPGIVHAPNIHPLFVHFPIALWSVALLFWGISVVVAKKERPWLFGRWLLYLGTLAALVTAATGLIAADRMGHDAPGHDLVHVHRDFMLAATGLGLATTAAAFLLRNATGVRSKAIPLVMLIVTVLVMTVGADRGAELVYRYGIGTAGESPPSTHADHHHDDDAVERNQGATDKTGEGRPATSNDVPQDDEAPERERQHEQEHDHRYDDHHH
jgi:uncharacterized membrane protein